MHQPNFFEKQTQEPSSAAAEQVVIYALGEFQARGKVLADRELPLDRLRGALRRAAETFGVAELTDEQAVATFRSLGASVRQVPSYVAKHPFRVTVQAGLADDALQTYHATVGKRGRTLAEE